MIDRLKYLNNIGRFESVSSSGQTDLGKLTLLFSENGRGKTTLCALLRSLDSGDPAPILERRRLSATAEPHAVIRCDGDDISFDGKSWRGSGPRIFIYDDHFIDANVCSGLDVEASHRKGVHALVLGERGVQKEREVQALTKEIAQHQAELRAAEQAVPLEARAGMSIDEFCALEKPDDLKNRIKDGRSQLSILRDAQKIVAAGTFKPIGFPDLGLEALEETLAASLEDIDGAALRAVGERIQDLGPGGEAWIADGVEKLGDDSTCPFCQQDISQQTLVTSYRLYFSLAYRAHKKRIESARRETESVLNGDRLAEFERTAERARSTAEFWAKHVSVPHVELESEKLANTWKTARTGLLTILDKKAGAPLDAASLDEETRSALTDFRDTAQHLDDLSNSLLAVNSSLEAVKSRAASGSVSAAESKLARLEATQQRYQTDIATSCEAYLSAKSMKADAERKKQEAREELDAHRTEAFGRQEGAINEVLDLFNADFGVCSLKPSDARGVPSSTYELRVNGAVVPLVAPEQPEPSFRTSLSAGDRNTLALAFFLVSLQEVENLQDAVVVLDDPCCSLDDARSFATVREILRLTEKTAQVVIMSHSSPFLCHLWEKADKTETAALQIRDCAAESSTIDTWDADAAAVEEYAKEHESVRDYVASKHTDSRRTAIALRSLLEHYTRVVYVQHFQPGENLGKFVARAKSAKANGNPIMAAKRLDELDQLRDYANHFHHDTSRNWERNLSNLNEVELKGFAKRVLKFVSDGHAI
ncbi:MAG: AAA family ATPase [Candidatus Eisenbacteria bacterium]